MKDKELRERYKRETAVICAELDKIAFLIGARYDGFVGFSGLSTNHYPSISRKGATDLNALDNRLIELEVGLRRLMNHLNLEEQTTPETTKLVKRKNVNK